MNPLRQVVKASGRPGPKVAVIAYRIRDDGKPEYVWITSTVTGKWGAIKGTIETYETPEETAHIEAKEEAGVKGSLRPLARHIANGVRISVYAMEITKISKNWKEKHERKRVILTYGKSRKLLGRNKNRNAWIIASLDKLHRLIKGTSN